MLKNWRLRNINRDGSKIVLAAKCTKNHKKKEKTIMKKLILLSLVFLAGCSSTKTISINSETVLNKNEKVDWAITHNDSIVDFRKEGNRYAKIVGDKLIIQHGKDSTKAYLISEFRTIHTFEHAPTLLVVILGSLTVTLIIIGYLLSGMKVG